MDKNIKNRLYNLVEILNVDEDVSTVELSMGTKSDDKGNEVVTGTLKVSHDDSTVTTLSIDILKGEELPLGCLETWSPEISSVHLVTCTKCGLIKAKLHGEGQRYTNIVLTATLTTCISLASMEHRGKATLTVDGRDIYLKNN